MQRTRGPASGRNGGAELQRGSEANTAGFVEVPAALAVAGGVAEADEDAVGVADDAPIRLKRERAGSRGARTLQPTNASRQSVALPRVLAGMYHPHVPYFSALAFVGPPGGRTTRPPAGPTV